MKQVFILTLAVIFTLASCKTKPEGTENTAPLKYSISGNVTGFSKPLSVYGREMNFQFQPDSAGNFSYEGELAKAGFYTLGYGSEKRQPIYLKPGTELKLEIDFEQLKSKKGSAVRISGKGSKESELLYQLQLNNPRSKYSKDEIMTKYLPKLYDRTPEDFAKYIEEQVESEYFFIDEFVKMNPEVEKAFVKNLKLNILIQRNNDFQTYDRYNQMLKTGRAKAPYTFQNYYADRIPQNDMELCAQNNIYKDYVRGLYYHKVEVALEDYPRESLEWYKARVEFLENCDFPAEVVQDIFDGFTIGYMRTRDPEVRAFITEQIKEKVSDEASLARWEEYKAREEGYNDGDMAPDFTHKDIRGNRISLSDFRGKLVYIDLWATWCVPCLKGVPYFAELRKKYAGDKIEFVAISLDENLDAWKKKVTENENGDFNGVQLFTGAYKCDVSENYVLQGIPQYILIGADGRIIKKNAPRPHGEEIVALIDAELAKLK